MTRGEIDATLRQFLKPPHMTLEEALACDNPVMEVVLRLPGDISRMTEAERTLWQVTYFLSDTDNGGIAQALSNDTGEFAPVVEEFARCHGPMELARAMGELAALFPQGVVPRHRDERNRQLERLPEPALGEITDRIYALRSEIEAALLRFIHGNMHAFPMDGDRSAAPSGGEP